MAVGGFNIPFVCVPVLAMGAVVGAVEPAGNICLLASDDRNINQNASFNNDLALTASDDRNENANGDWSTC